MKTFPCLFTLLFSLVCHAQSERWQLHIPIAGDNPTNSGVFSDGVGGGVVLITGLPQYNTRAVWFNASGAVILTNDFKVQANSGSQPGIVDVLRVTPKILDLKLVVYPPPFGQERVTLRRIAAKGLEAKETALSETDGAIYQNERTASIVTPQPDKRGFFTVQLNTTNVLIRRYTF